MCLDVVTTGSQTGPLLGSKVMKLNDRIEALASRTDRFTDQ
jgi:hypothetical protein